MRAIDENSITSVAIEQMATTKDPRLKRAADSPFPDLPAIQLDFRLATATTKDVAGRVGADPSQIVTKLAG